MSLDSLLIPVNMVGELAALLLAALILFFMIYTTPRLSSGYRLDFEGIGYSIVGSLILQLVIGPWFEQLGGTVKAACVFCLMYIYVYHQILYRIFQYINLILARERLWSKLKRTLAVIFSVAYFVPSVVLLVRFMVNPAPYATPLGVVISTVHYCAFFGILLAAGCCWVGIRGRKAISRVVRATLTLFIPILLIVLILQMVTSKDVFIGVTYVLPFAIFYLLFHSNPYDERMGTMNYESMTSALQELVVKGEHYVAVEVRFPQLAKTTTINDSARIQSMMIRGCNQAERLGKNVHIYREDRTTFMLLSKVESRKAGKEIAKGIFELVDGMRFDSHALFYYKILVIYSDPAITDMQSFQMFRQFLRANMNEYTNSQFRVASQKDYDDFTRNYQIRQALNDIRDRNNLDDPRVLCYAQPIYSVDREGFYTAESLMRLNLGGEIVSPAEVIPLAEELHCVHALSCIMLSKVCKAIKELGDKYEYDAITMNVSATELSDPSVCSDFYQIITSNHVPVEKIRIEITESAIFEDLETVNDNIRRLQENGICLLLDDFGTGYSNFERLSSVNFHTIKFDKIVLYKAMENRKLDELMTSMVQMLKKDDVNMLVEGVENEEQSRYSIDRGFSYIQGFQYAKPAPIERLKEYFHSTEKAAE